MKKKRGGGASTGLDSYLNDESKFLITLIVKVLLVKDRDLIKGAIFVLNPVFRILHRGCFGYVFT